jgi:hypothetical protein
MSQKSQKENKKSLLRAELDRELARNRRNFIILCVVVGLVFLGAYIWAVLTHHLPWPQI